MESRYGCSVSTNWSNLFLPNPLSLFFPVQHGSPTCKECSQGANGETSSGSHRRTQGLGIPAPSGPHRCTRLFRRCQTAHGYVLYLRELYSHPLTQFLDFSTIQHKISTNQYKTFDSFVDDAQLVFDNCRLYNPENTVYAKNARFMDQFFKGLLSQHWKQEEEKSAKEGR